MSPKQTIIITLVSSTILFLVLLLATKKQQRKEGIDTRENRRFDIQPNMGLIKLNNQEYEVLNISRRGAQVRCDGKFSIKDRLNFEIGEVSGIAEVRWCQEQESIIGIQFINTRFDECRKFAKHTI